MDDLNNAGSALGALGQETPANPGPGAVTAEQPGAVTSNVLAEQAAPAIDPSYALEIGGDDWNGAKTTIDLSKIPGPTRMNFLRQAVKAFVTNRVTTAGSRTKKLNETHDQYDAAIKADPLQSAVPAPTTARTVTDFAGIIDNAIRALYDGTAGKPREANADTRSRAPKDPLISQITKAVISDVYQKAKAADSNYKYPTAAKEVGTDGLAYLKSKIEARVAAGEDRKPLEDFLETRYVKPARIMLGMDTPGKLKDAGGIL